MNWYITTRKVDYVHYDETLAVDVEADCGEKFMSAAYIIEPDSENPLIVIPRPLGAQLTMVIAKMALEKRTSS